MLKAIKNLIVALLNATLILVVLSLFLAWKVTDKVEGLAGDFARNLITVAPLREDIQSTTTELAALRSDLAAIRAQSGEVTSVNLQRIETRLDQTQARLDGALKSVSDLTQAPARLIDHAIETGADKFSQSVKDIRGCAAPDA